MVAIWLKDLADGRRMYEVVIYQVLLGAVLGVIIGFAARRALRWAHDRQWVDFL